MHLSYKIQHWASAFLPVDISKREICVLLWCYAK